MRSGGPLPYTQGKSKKPWAYTACPPISALFFLPSESDTSMFPSFLPPSFFLALSKLLLQLLLLLSYVYQSLTTPSQLLPSFMTIPCSFSRHIRATSSSIFFS